MSNFTFKHGVMPRGFKGAYKHPLYDVWNSMILRCTHSKSQGYKNYGGRGIKVCDEWYCFENFIADMGEKPNSKHTLERIDNDGHYCPENCVWATWREQAKNRRKMSHVPV